MRLLIVEDEVSLADTLADGLAQDGWAVDVAYDGTSGWEKAQTNRYDVIVLDRDLPGMHGDDLCRRLNAQTTEARILMLTAAADVSDRVDGLRLGADDYLGKPFAFAELEARLEALARRAHPVRPPLLEHGDLVVDQARRLVHRGGVAIHLTRKEFAVLQLLMAADGAVVSAEELLERAWDEYADPFTNAVRIAVGTLRKKLGDPPVIRTVIGAGYRIGGE